MRSRFSMPVIAIFAAAAIGAFAIGCGGDDDGGETVSAEEYVSSVCTSLADLGSVLENSQSELQEAVTSDPEQGKEVLVGFLNDSAAAIEDANQDLADAGVPDVEDGETIAETVQSAFSELQRAIENAADDAEAVSTESPTQYIEEVEGVGRTIQQAGDQISESLGELSRSEELEAAAEESEACQDFGS